jgi:hypothetical protein
LSGNDLLRGGDGADLLDGGEGIDTADYRDSDAGVSVNLATGSASGGMADGDVFVAIERIYGSNHQDSLIGSDENNFLAGYGGNDLLTGCPATICCAVALAPICWTAARASTPPTTATPMPGSRSTWLRLG